MSEKIVNSFDKKLRRMIEADIDGLDIDEYFYSKSNTDDKFLQLYSVWKSTFDYSTWADLFEEIKGYTPDLIYSDDYDTDFSDNSN